jgi:hypothetical protein
MTSPSVHPSQQRQLDIPCGNYSEVNAIASLYHDIPKFTWRALKMAPLTELALGWSLDNLLDTSAIRPAFGCVSKKQCRDQNPLNGEGEIQP